MDWDVFKTAMREDSAIDDWDERLATLQVESVVDGLVTFASEHSYAIALILLICLVSLGMFAACVPIIENKEIADEPIWEPCGVFFYRAIDDEAGVVCWTRMPGSNGGLFCLPIEQTSLGARRGR